MVWVNHRAHHLERIVHALHHLDEPVKQHTVVAEKEYTQDKELVEKEDVEVEQVKNEEVIHTE